MPELPEVETVRRSLKPLLNKKQIERVEIYQPVVVAHPSAAAFREGLLGRRIVGFDRRGKYLILWLEREGRLVVHLRMTGRLLYTNREEPVAKHTHLIFFFADGQQLRYCDTRRFGRLWLLEKGEEDVYTGMAKLGPEPFAPPFGAAYLCNTLRNRRITIKQALLDQSVVAGLGNIYTDESLFVARIHPARPMDTLRLEEWEALADAIPRVLASSIENRGTSFRDYMDSLGRRGENLAHLYVYAQKGKPCKICGQPVERTVLAGRSTFYCPHCQPLAEYEKGAENRC